MSSYIEVSDHQLERQAMIMRLKDLKVMIAGWELPPSHRHYIEDVYIKDIWQKEEALEEARKLKVSKQRHKIPTRPDPEAVKEVLHWMRKDKKHKEAGTREFY